MRRPLRRQLLWQQRRRIEAYDDVIMPAAAGGQTLTASIHTDSEGFFTQSLSSAIALGPALHPDAESFFTQSLLATKALSPPLYPDADAFFTQTIASGARDLAPALFTDTEGFFTQLVSPGAVALGPALHPDADGVLHSVAAGDAGAVSGAPYRHRSLFYPDDRCRGGSPLPGDLHRHGRVLYAGRDRWCGVGVDLRPGQGRVEYHAVERQPDGDAGIGAAARQRFRNHPALDRKVDLPRYGQRHPASQQHRHRARQFERYVDQRLARYRCRQLLLL